LTQTNQKDIKNPNIQSVRKKEKMERKTNDPQKKLAKKLGEETNNRQINKYK